MSNPSKRKGDRAELDVQDGEVCTCKDAASDPPERDRLWVNDERTTLVRLWASGTLEIATRKTTSDTWGPPFYLTEESA